ncbi:hypothetical protein BJ912DRAFT_118800 [Pholiota molesta]|nr:hypothetical protein BJ912DRAFT_118800 [Pholiota molesta]
MKPTKTTKVRCFFFTEDGEPRRKACFKGPDCTFLHPDDPGWETGISGKTPWVDRPDRRSDSGWNDMRHAPGHSSYQEGYDRRESRWRPEHDDSRRPSGSKPRSRLSRSPSPRRSRESRSPDDHSRRRRDSGMDSRSRQRETEREGRRRSYDDPATHQRDRDRRDQSPSSIASSTNEPPRPTEQSQMPSTRAVLPTSSTTTGSLASAPRDVGWSIATSSNPGMKAPPTRPRPATERRASIAMPPPPPSATPPPPPGSTLPPSPFSRPAPEVQQGPKLDIRNATLPEPSPEEKVTMWLERTKLLADSVQTYERFETLEEEYDKAVKATESRFFDSLPAEDRKRLNTQVTALVSQRVEALRSYQEIRDQLVETSPWPIAPLRLSAEESEQHTALVKSVNELRDTVDKVLHSLGEIHKPPPQLFLAGNDSDEEEESRFMPMDVDPSSRSTSKKIPLPSRKRQRMGGLADDTGHAKSSQLNEDMPTRKELEEYHDKLGEYQDALSQLWNHCNISEEDKMERFKEELNDRIEKIQQKRAKEQQMRDSKRKQQEDARQDAIEKMDAQISQDGKDIEKLSTEMTDLINDVDKLQDELHREKLARDASYDRAEELDKRLNGYIVAQQANTATLETLSVALKAYTTRPPSPPMSPRVAAPSYLLQSLEQPLVDSLRASIQPLMQQLRGDIEKLVQEKNAQLFSTVWEKISQTLKVLSLIQQRMDADRSVIRPQASMASAQ